MLNLCSVLTLSMAELWRLNGGLLPNEGMVEVYHNNQWGSICIGSGWTLVWGHNAAEVVCRSIGLPPPPGDLRVSQFPEFKDQTKVRWMNNVRCQGNESSLDQCQHDGMRRFACTYSYTANVVCGGPKRKYHSNINYWTTFRNYCTPSETSELFSVIFLNRKALQVSVITICLSVILRCCP